VTLTFKLDLDMVKMNQLASYIGQTSFISKVVFQTQIQAHQTDRCTWTVEVVGQNV